MDTAMLEQHLENLDHRLASVEQILPTLATKDDLKSLATKTELEAAIARLTTKEEVRATEGNLRLAITDAVAELRRHTHVLTESLRGDIHMLAAHAASERPKHTDT